MTKRRQFTMRLDDDIWVFLKKRSYDMNISLTQLISDRLDKYKKKYESKLTPQKHVVP